MNLVDFTVTKILEEREGPLWQLYDMTEAEAHAKAKDNKEVQELLFSEGVKQVYEYNCYGSVSVATNIFSIGKGERYYVGYKGLC